MPVAIVVESPPTLVSGKKRPVEPVWDAGLVALVVPALDEWVLVVAAVLGTAPGRARRSVVEVATLTQLVVTKAEPIRLHIRARPRQRRQIRRQNLRTSAGAGGMQARGAGPVDWPSVALPAEKAGTTPAPADKRAVAVMRVAASG